MESHLRVNFTYYQTDDRRNRKINFSLFSSRYIPLVDMKCDVVFFPLEAL